MKTIHESGVDFGPYREEELFHIEQSKLYQDLGQGLKATEFVLQADNNIIFVEAKTNAPNPENKDDSSEKSQKFETFFREVPDKFIDSLGVYTAALLKRYPDTSEIGVSLQRPDLAGIKIVFALVITNPAAETDWLSPIKSVLEDRLRRWMKIWDIDIIVLNQALAKRFGIIK